MNEHNQMDADSTFRDRIKVVQAAAEFGVICYDQRTGAIELDDAAAVLHGEGSKGAHVLALDDWASMLREEDQLRGRAFICAIPNPGETERTTIRLAGPDPRHPRLLELSVRRVDDEKAVGACRDVTRERSNEALRRQKLAAERANQAKSEFMSHISHELRTPLNAILGFTQLMAMDRHSPLPPVHVERLEIVRHSGMRLLGLIDQLLQITKIERGQSTLRSKAVNVRAVIGHCLASLELSARARGILVDIDIERPELAAVRADPDALEQVL